MPTPDDYGRYRVRHKGDTASPAWSTRTFNPDRHVIVPGDASDTYGNALPPKPIRRLAIESPEPEAASAATDVTPTEEEESDR